jgi:N-acetylglucosaminyl-diphospho-decaprenol L-rhamnosyltransferase
VPRLIHGEVSSRADGLRRQSVPRRPVAPIDVVIPTWNGRDLLERCLETLAGQTADHRVIVVDNGSTDDTTVLVRDCFPTADLVELGRNFGFAGGVNRGVEQGEAPVVVLVNNDVECDALFLERLVAPLLADERIGMVAGLLLRPGRGVIDSYGLECDATLAAYPRFAGAPYPGTLLHEDDLLGPSGGAAGYRRDAYAAAGGLDERMFAYMEDVDLALRLRGLGWLAAGAPEATGIHLGSATIGRRSRAQVEVAGASRAYMLRKYGVLGRGLTAAAWALPLEAGVTVIETVAGRDLAAARGRLSGWRAAAGQHARIPDEAVNRNLGLRDSLRRRLETVR